MKDHILLVVLYNRDIHSSTTLASYLNDCNKYHSKIKLVIWDNSPERMIDKISFNEEYEYYHTSQNISLAKIYNTVIDSHPNIAYISIFDQDSIIDESYLSKLFQAISENPSINLFIPKIIHKGRLLSPAIRSFHRGKYYKHINVSGEISSKRLLGIMSGMTVKTEFVRNGIVRFDEKLNLYGIDSKFSLDYSLKFDKLFVIEYSLKHSLSKFEKEDRTLKNIRRKSMETSSLYIAKNISFCAYLFCKIAIIKNKIYDCLFNIK